MFGKEKSNLRENKTGPNDKGEVIFFCKETQTFGRFCPKLKSLQIHDF